MILVGGNRPFRLDEFEEHLRRHDELAKKRVAYVSTQKQHVLDLIQEADGPIKIVDVANCFAKESGHRWDSRATKAELRLRAFRIVAGCLKEFLIARHRRKWVVYLGPDNPLRKAWHQRIEDTIKNFPKPNI